MKWLVICFSATLLLGCASVEVERITDENRATAKGIRFWRPALYLAVFAGKDDSCSGKLIVLPDPKEEYVMRATAGLGSVSLKPTLTDGWNLTAFDSTADSKAADVLGVFGKLSGAEAAEAKKGRRIDISPGLYRIRMEPDKGSLSLDVPGVYEAGSSCATLKLPEADGGKGGAGKDGK